MATLVIEPGNVLPRIEEVWLAVSVDENGEGLCAVTLGGMLMPLVAADPARKVFIERAAADFAREQGRLVRIVKLTTRVEVAVYDGRKG